MAEGWRWAWENQPCRPTLSHQTISSILPNTTRGSLFLDHATLLTGGVVVLQTHSTLHQAASLTPPQFQRRRLHPIWRTLEAARSTTRGRKQVTKARATAPYERTCGINGAMCIILLIITADVPLFAEVCSSRSGQTARRRQKKADGWLCLARGISTLSNIPKEYCVFEVACLLPHLRSSTLDFLALPAAPYISWSCLDWQLSYPPYTLKAHSLSICLCFEKSINKLANWRPDKESTSIDSRNIRNRHTYEY